MGKYNTGHETFDELTQRISDLIELNDETRAEETAYLEGYLEGMYVREQLKMSDDLNRKMKALARNVRRRNRIYNGNDEANEGDRELGYSSKGDALRISKYIRDT